MQHSEPQKLIAPAVSSRLNTRFKNPVCPRTMYAPPVPEVFIIEHGFPGKQTLP